jgi:hypothetical protein
MAETIKSESALAGVMIVAVTQGDALYLLWLGTVRILAGDIKRAGQIPVARSLDGLKFIR